METKKIILYGASNYGYEVADLIFDINRSANAKIYSIEGFIDDNAKQGGELKNDLPILGNRSWIETNDISSFYFICCIGNPETKAKVVAYLESKKAKFTILIHPSAIVSATATIEEGAIIMAGNILSTKCYIAKHVILNLACTIGHNTLIGKYSTINPGSNISGDVNLEEGVLVGTNATILEKLTVGSYTTVGAASLVHTNLPEKVVVFGMPARILKSNK